jgi:hypothetical protein
MGHSAYWGMVKDVFSGYTQKLTFRRKIETMASPNGHTAMRRFRRKYYDLFSKSYDRFIALHATDKPKLYICT